MFTTVGMNHRDQAFFSDTKIQWYIKHKNYFQKYILFSPWKVTFVLFFSPLLNQINDYQAW